MFRNGVKKELFLNQQQRDFLLSITHELKSPIAGIQLAVETILNRPNLKEERKNKLLNNSIKDADRLKTLVENILMAARIDNESYTITDIELNFSKLTSDLTRKISTSKTPELTFDISPDIWIKGDEGALVSIITNLIENAVKYSPPQSPIYLSLKKENDSALLLVADQGIGISSEDKKIIFDKFVRIGNEGTRKTKGTGLGLFIVKQLVLLHKGKIDVKDNSPKGSVFSMQLPAIDPVIVAEENGQLLEKEKLEV